MKETAKDNMKFISKVMVSHIITYIFCGILFSTIFNYQNDLLEQTNMRNMDDTLVKMAPLFQIIRGLLYGLVLVFLKDSIIYEKYGIIKLYILMIIIGIINTPAPSPGSIEGFIYIKNDLISTNLDFGVLEIIIQNLLFCILVCTKWRKQKNNIVRPHCS
ncbi:MAG: hypothetical protein LBP25_05240 [Tannerellaceae bacterium]|jgi:hypothetical protein|nr:hypothetical protein [Tannerellaceae bacterium]